jgi:hypothetical protein
MNSQNLSTLGIQNLSTRRYLPICRLTGSYPETEFEELCAGPQSSAALLPSRHLASVAPSAIPTNLLIAFASPKKVR